MNNVCRSLRLLWYHKNMVNGISSIALTGLTRTSADIQKSAENITKSGTEEGADINVAEEIVKMKTLEVAYKANLEILETDSELQEELLRLFDERV